MQVNLKVRRIALVLFAAPVFAAAQTTVNMYIEGTPPVGVTRPNELARLSFLIAGSNEAAQNPFAEIRLPGDLQFAALGLEFTTATCTTPAVGSSGIVRCMLRDDGLLRINLDVRVAPQATIGSVLHTVAEVGSDGIEGSPENNIVSLALPVQSGNEVADMRARVEVDQNPVAPRAAVNFRVVVENAGPDVASWATIEFFSPTARQEVAPGFTAPVPGMMPSRLDWAADWDCEAFFIPQPVLPTGPTGIRCRRPQMPPGSQLVITFSGNARTDVLGPITFSATARSVSTDPAAGNNASGTLAVPIGFASATPIPAGSNVTVWLLVTTVLLGAIAARRTTA
jgi:hypothetical protein